VTARGGPRSARRAVAGLAVAAIAPVATVGMTVIPAMPAAAATGWMVVPSVDPSTRPVSLANQLNAVTARTATDAWAVGTYSGAGRHDGQVMLAERWNGSAWSQVATPNVTFFDERLLAVSASSANDAWAVGSTSQTSFATTNPIAAHWDGSSWTIVSTPATTGSAKSMLFGVADLGPVNAWAVGRSRSGSALIEHWDGASWTIVPGPNPAPAAGQSFSGSTLCGIAARSATDIWAVGSYSTLSGTTANSFTLTEHWNGTTWSVVPSPNPAVRSHNGAQQVLHAVAAISPTDVWAVGDTIDTATGSFLPDKTLTMHWNGSAWSVVASPDHPAEDELLAVTAASSSDVWAVGDFVQRTSTTTIARSLTLHWNGTSWSTVASPNGGDGSGDTILTGASALSSGEVWAAGFYLAPSYKTLILHHTP
jgi:hypothetical protein